MEDMASLWSYQEKQKTEELKQKLLYTTLELESVKMEANEENLKNTEYAKQLLQLLKITCQERDEAREQIHKLLLNNLIPSTTPPPPPPPQQLFTPPIKANSSITESNSLSYSSPADSFFDSVSSPELSTINMADSSNLLGFVNQSFVQDYDHACLIIEKIVKGKALPQKGELLQSVVEAGPLLQTLLVAGPLPQWRNPPPPLQPLKIPPVSINGCGAAAAAAEMVAQEADVNYLSFGPNSLSSSSFVEMSSCGSSFQSQMLAAAATTTTTTTTTTSVLDFGGGVSGSCLGGRKVIPPGANANDYAQLGKRQRFQ